MGKKNKKNKKIEGNFIANEKGFGFVEVDGEEQDFFIPAKNVNGALNGDVVEFVIEKPKQGDRRAEGKIVKVLKRDKSTVVGVFQRSKNFGFVVPDDKKFGTDIFISKNKCKNAKNNDKVIAKITKYPDKNNKGKNAEGEIIEVLGNVNQAGIDMLSVIKEFDLPNEFPSFVKSEAEKMPKSINKDDIKNRRDLRCDTIFTIDGEDAKDLDDAINVYKNGEGNYCLDVHIADVSHYVTENSALDKEAIKRGTSVYMFDRVIPMLPVELSNGICSLNAGEDRFALSCSMEINDKGQVISSDVYKSIIKVTERMSYTDVNKILNNLDEEVIEKYNKYINNFKLMEELAIILKNRRLEQGYLNLDIPESKIVLDENGKVIEVKKYETTFANEIIEQFMLTANEAVAEKFYWLEAPFIYRVHEDPEYEKIEETNKFLFNIGEKIKVTKDKIMPKAFSVVLDKLKGTEYEKVISTLILRTLKLARYESENKGHFGIASKYYCHFTSPIRRYPDLFIHRVISEYLQKNYNLDEERIEILREKSQKYAQSSTETEKNATKAEREAEDIKKAEYMEDKIGEEYFGIVSSITQFGMFVELESTVEGLIRFENMGNEYFIYDENRKTLTGENTKRSFKIGDQVKIRVIEANKMLRKVAFELVEEDDEEIVENQENAENSSEKRFLRERIMNKKLYNDSI